MPILPIPPDPKLNAPTHVTRAEHFAGYSTADLIQLIRQTDPPEGVDEDKAIVAAHERGQASHLDLLIGLHERANREVFDAAVVLCHDADPDERYLGLRILGELGGDRPLFPETWELLEDMADTEDNIHVIPDEATVLVVKIHPGLTAHVHLDLVPIELEGKHHRVKGAPQSHHVHGIIAPLRNRSPLL